MALNFPDSPVDGETTTQPNGVTYRWSAAKTRWDASLVPVAPAILGAVTMLAASDAAWVPDGRTVYIRFTVTGAGGGGGGVQSSTGSGTLSNGGCGGATAIKGSDVIDASYNVTIGAGGAGGAAGQNNGAAGGASTVVSATLDLNGAGGFGGDGRSSGTNTNRVGKVGPLATGGDTNIPGGDAQSGAVVESRPTLSTTSGGSFWGHGRRIPNNDIPDHGNAPGVGGSGNSHNDNSTNRAGGDGADGICMIEEFFAAPVTV